MSSWWEIDIDSFMYQQISLELGKTPEKRDFCI